MKWMPAVTLTMLLAAAGCATTPEEKNIPDIRDNDPLIVQLSDTARVAFESGEIPKAVVMYRRALDRARAMDNAREIGRNAYNLAASLIALEDWDDVPGLLGEAERETLRAGGDAGPIILLSAETKVLQRDWSGAEKVIDRLETMTVSDIIRGQAYVLRARISCERNDAGRADAFLNRARGYLSKQREPGLAAAISEVAGRIAVLKGNWAEAAVSFDREAAWLQRAGRLPEMADALERAGQNYLKAGDTTSAADRLFRSARSLMAQGNYLDALRVVDLAVQNAEPGNTEGDAAAIARLFEDIRRSLEKNSRAGVP